MKHGEALKKSPEVKGHGKRNAIDEKASGDMSN